METSNKMGHIRDKVEQRLSDLVPEHPDSPNSRLYRAARYSLLGNAKRLRPLFTILTAESLGSSSESALDSACALEMIHTYSLIHDDLPCMDDDDFRRGKPSLHKVFGEAHAVLTGDYLLTYAFEVIANDKHLSPEQKISLILLLAKSSGGHGMVGGQMMDVEAESIPVDAAQLNLIYKYKTGELITSSIIFGGIIANAPMVQIDILRRFGQDIGLAFQIADDVLDVVASREKHGKDVSSDIINQKTTYVSLYGVESAQETAMALLAGACETLSQLPFDTTDLAALATSIIASHHPKVTAQHGQ